MGGTALDRGMRLVRILVAVVIAAWLVTGVLLWIGAATSGREAWWPLACAAPALGLALLDGAVLVAVVRQATWAYEAVEVASVVGFVFSLLVVLLMGMWLLLLVLVLHAALLAVAFRSRRSFAKPANVPTPASGLDVPVSEQHDPLRDASRTEGWQWRLPGGR